MGTADFKKYLPARMTVEGVKARIRTVNDFRRIVGYKSDWTHGRTSELTRILKMVNQNALEFIHDRAGGMTTRYAEREYKLNQRAIRRQRRKTERDMHTELYDGDDAIPDWQDALGRAVERDGNDLARDDEGEPDSSVEDGLDPAEVERWRREDAARKREQVTPDAMYEVYMSVWRDPMNFHSAMPGYNDLIKAMDWLVENRPDVLNKMFASGRDEIDPWYITESGGASNPYVNTPYETRHNRAVMYITGVAANAGGPEEFLNPAMR